MALIALVAGCRKNMDIHLWWEPGWEPGWEPDASELPVSFIALGPGSPPQAHEVWGYYLFKGESPPGGWSYLHASDLMRFSDDARDSLVARPDTQSGAGYGLTISQAGEVKRQLEVAREPGSGLAQVWHQAETLLAARLGELANMSQPDYSATRLWRARVAEDHLIVDVAPVASVSSPEQATARALLGIGPLRVGVATDGRVTWCGEPPDMQVAGHAQALSIALPDQAPVTLPGASIRWPMRIDDSSPEGCYWRDGVLYVTTSSTAALQVLVASRVMLPECHIAAVCERWIDESIGSSVGALQLRAPLPTASRD